MSACGFERSRRLILTEKPFEDWANSDDDVLLVMARQAANRYQQRGWRSQQTKLWIGAIFFGDEAENYFERYSKEIGGMDDNGVNGERGIGFSGVLSVNRGSAFLWRLQIEMPHTEAETWNGMLSLISTALQRRQWNARQYLVQPGSHKVTKFLWMPNWLYSS